MKIKCAQQQQIKYLCLLESDQFDRRLQSKKKKEERALRSIRIFHSESIYVFAILPEMTIKRKYKLNFV